MRLVLLLAAACGLFAAPPPIPTPPGVHPRLYLRDVGDLRRRVAHPVLKPVWDSLQARTEPQLRLEAEALRYLLSRDGAAARRTVAETLALLEGSNFDLSIQDISRRIGRLMCTGAMVYDWCYPVLTAEQKQAFIAQFVRLAKQLECHYPPRMGWVTGHGSEWMLMRDMLSAGVAIYDEFPEMYRLAAEVIFGEIVPARNWWYAGHAFHQGSSYAETRFVSDLFPLFIFDRLGAGNIFSPEQRYVSYQWIYMRRPDGQLLRSGDGQSKPPALRGVLAASYYKDPYILGDYLRTPGIDSYNRIYELLWRDPDLQPRPADDLPLSRYMGPPYGWMVARTGWDAASVIAEMKVNVYNFVNHQHLDAGAFQIYYQGPLAIDSGLYQGSDGGYHSPHHVNYCKRTIAHNSLLVLDPGEKFGVTRGTTLVNDGGQRLPNNWREAATLAILTGNPEYRTGTVLAHDFGPDARRPDYTYLAGDITAAYSAKVKHVERSFVFLNLGGTVPAAMVVFDDVVAANPAFRKTWLLHSMEEPVLKGRTATVAAGGGRLTDTVLLPEAAEVTRIGGPGREFMVGGTNFPNRPTRGRPEDFEIGAWRVEVSPKAASARDLFLNVMQVAPRQGGTTLPVESVAGRNAAGVRIAGRVVVFPREAGDLAFTVRGEPARVLVAGLAAGRWSAQRGPRTVYSAAVSAEAQTFYFTAEPGEYSIVGPSK